MLDLTKLGEAIRHEGGVSRRLFLAYAASLSTIPLLGRRAAASERRISFESNPFTLGVASGDPSDNGAVLWTRLAPRPLEPGGGMPPEAVDVAWEIASDDAMRNIVHRGVSVATPQLAHTVHVELNNLEPDRWYWYRFRAGDAESTIGRARTLPAANTMPEKMRFAFASCQHYETGLYTAYEHMAKEELDLVFHLGDYIYEYGGEDGKVRKHVGRKIESLDDYRIRHALYKSDPLLQAAHARCPWMVTWDDHEVENDYACDISEVPGLNPAKFLTRRAAAYQAYYEMMPLRSTSVPSGPNMQLYRKASFGQLGEFLVLDTRQHRSDQPSSDEVTDVENIPRSPNATMLGAQQLDWAQQSLLNSPATWNVMAQQVMMACMDFEEGKRLRYYSDGWPAYLVERERLMQFLHDHKVANPVVLTGDFHSNFAIELRVDDRKAELPVVATEIVGTSISSAGDGEDQRSALESLMAENPGLKFLNDQRGYVRCTLTPDEWRTDFRVVEYVSKPGAPIKDRATYVIEAGQPGVKQA
jgi:alkaline phosphatase D